MTGHLIVVLPCKGTVPWHLHRLHMYDSFTIFPLFLSSICMWQKTCVIKTVQVFALKLPWEMHSHSFSTWTHTSAGQVPFSSPLVALHPCHSFTSLLWQHRPSEPIAALENKHTETGISPWTESHSASLIMSRLVRMFQRLRLADSKMTAVLPLYPSISLAMLATRVYTVTVRTRIHTNKSRKGEHRPEVVLLE